MVSTRIRKLGALLALISLVSYSWTMRSLSKFTAMQQPPSMPVPEHSSESEKSSPQRILQNASEETLPRNRSLVIVLGELRGGEDTWRTLFDNVLDVNSADLAVFTTNNITYADNPLIQRARYVWRHREYDDWADAIDTINGTSWRSTHLPKFHDHNVYSYPGKNRSILFGGLAGHECDPMTARTSWCEHDGSGIIVFMLRHWLMERIRDEVLDLYDMFVVTRPDNMYLCEHEFAELDLSNHTVWVPTGEEYGGYCDRHLVASRATILPALDVMRELTHKPYAWDYEKHHNTERFMKHAWHEKDLNVRQFPRVMFTVKKKDDKTRWQKGLTELPSHPGLIVKYQREWYEAQNRCALRWTEKNAAKLALRQTTKFTIIILTMNRMHSLRRLVRSLMHEDCQYSLFGIAVNLEFHIDRPKKRVDEGWLDLIRWTTNLTWPHGTVTSLVAKENMGLRDSWFNAWKPTDDSERAIILEDDVEVSPPWFRWVNGAYDAYSGERSVAGFSIQRQDLVPMRALWQKKKAPTNDNRPYLYSLLGSIGFAPNPRVWREFIEWTECALCNGVDPSVEGLITSHWYRIHDKKSIWEQHLVYYMYYHDMYCLYQFPKNETEALGIHWRESGEHFQGTASASHSKVLDMGSIAFPEMGSIQKYDWSANLVSSTPPKTLVLSAAVGYNDLALYSMFCETLRKHYDSNVMLLLGEGASNEITKILREHNVMHEEVNKAESWAEFNIRRFKYYSAYCKGYDYCMALDFRDSFFQDNPFRFLNAEAGTDLFFQAHAVSFGQRVKGIPAHWKMIPACANNNETVAEEYRACLSDNALINAGGIVGKGHAFEQLESIVTGIANEGCSDQMAVNIGVYCNLLSSLKSVKVFKQGTGPINTLGYGSRYLKLGKKVGNLDCLPSPVIHQWDMVNLSAPAPLGGGCVSSPGEFEKQEIPGGGYILVPRHFNELDERKPVQSTGVSPFQPAKEVLSQRNTLEGG